MLPVPSISSHHPKKFFGNILTFQRKRKSCLFGLFAELGDTDDVDDGHKLNFVCYQVLLLGTGHLQLSESFSFFFRLSYFSFVDQVVDIQDRDKEFGVMVLQNGILKLLEFYTTSDESTSQWVSAFNLLKGTKYVLDQEPPWTTASNLVLKCNKIAKQGEKTSEPSNFRIKVKLGDQHHTFGVGDSCKVRIGSSIGDDEIIKISVSCDHEKMGEIEMTVLHVKRNWRKNLGDMSVHSLIHHKHKTGSIELSMKLKKIKENAEGKTAVQSSVSFSRMLKGKSFTTDDKEEKEKEREKEKEKEEQVEMRASSFF